MACLRSGMPGCDMRRAVADIARAHRPAAICLRPNRRSLAMSRRKDRTDTSSISLTAHYTGHVWYRNGLSADAFSTTQGALYYGLLAPFEALGNRLVGTNVRESLLQRHFLIDHLIEEAITREGITQVLEIACGLSPRGWRFTNRF